MNLQTARSEGSSTAGTDIDEDLEEGDTDTTASGGGTPKMSPVPEDGSFPYSAQHKHGSSLAQKNKRRRSSTDDLTAAVDSSGDGSNIILIPICLSDTLKRHLEVDCVNITKKRRLTRIPAEPNAVSVLEDFVRHYGKFHRGFVQPPNGCHYTAD